MTKLLLVFAIATIMIFGTFTAGNASALPSLPENLPDVSQAPSHVRIIEGENIIAYARALYTSTDNPSNHVVLSGAPYDGVAKLILTRTDGTFGCSGTLASDNIHVFTAAHCVADDNGNYILTSGSATFEGAFTPITISIDAENSVKHPAYNGDYIKGNDIAILKLGSIPSGVPGITHAITGSEVGNTVDKSGYGISGYFDSGTEVPPYYFGTQREGQNRYDSFADTMYVALGLTSGVDFIPGAIYQFDSDDGTSGHDAFGYFFGISNTGLGNNEVMSASGDSGGPTFENGELVGITSYGITLQYTNRATSDCTKQFGGPKLDSSCGEFAGDTRVSQYADWIASVLTPVNDVDPPVISAISSDTSSTTATITWTTTNEPATSLVEYDTDANYDIYSTYGSSVSDANFVTSHSVELTGLSPSTVYHFMVTSDDASDNSASSDDAQFTTTSPPILESISISPLNSNVDVDATLQYTATGHYVDTSTNDLTDLVAWSSTNTDIATIDVHGLATGVSPGGSVDIIATLDSFVPRTGLTVNPVPDSPTSTTASVSYFTEGGKNSDKHLNANIAFDPIVVGASTTFTLYLDNIFVGSATTTIGDSGVVGFSVKNASSGQYTTDVTVMLNGESLDVIIIDGQLNNGFTK